MNSRVLGIRSNFETFGFLGWSTLKTGQRLVPALKWAGEGGRGTPPTTKVLSG